MKKNDFENDVVRISFPLKSKGFDLDPSRIGNAYEAIILENMYAKLVNYDENSQIVSDLADEFFWEEDHFSFVFSGNTKTSKGNSIGPKDVAFSLKRLILNNKNTHGKLREYICDDEKFQSIDDECRGIVVRDNTLKLFPRENVSRDLLLALLTGVDFLIIPEAAMSKKFPYEIIDYSETTGAYFLNGKDKSLDFKINEYSSRFQSAAIREWRIVPTEISVSTDQIPEKFDMVTSASFVNIDQKNEDIELFKSLPLSIEQIVFTSKGRREFSSEERAYVALRMKEVVKGTVENFQQETFQLFPKDAVGWLPFDKELKYRALLKKNTKPTKKFRVGIPKTVFSRFSKHIILLNSEHNIEITEYNMLGLIDNFEQIDAGYVVTDSTFYEDISVFEYGFSFGFFGTDQKFGYDWMKRFIGLKSSERTDAIQKLHFDVLMELKAAPLYSSPYLIVGSKKFDFSKMPKNTASTHLWKVKKKWNF